MTLYILGRRADSDAIRSLPIGDKVTRLANRLTLQLPKALSSLFLAKPLWIGVCTVKLVTSLVELELASLRSL